MRSFLLKRQVLVFSLFLITINLWSQFADSGILLPGVSNSSVVWGDFDNDGDLDILLSGSGISKIYRNDGDNTFLEQTGILLTGLYFSSADWGDYDNDGDLDILITGATTSSVTNYNPISKIYRNNGNKTFSEQTSISLTAVHHSSVAWGDYDNDGYLDILLTGETGSYPDYLAISKIYHNNGNNTFQEQTNIFLPGVQQGSSNWGDYDNDGDLDILLSGYRSSGYITSIYRNNADNTFTEQPVYFNRYYGGGGYSAWGDYDGDGDLDILLTGRGSAVYRNNGDNAFSIQYSLTGVYYSSSEWGDYDNDGDLDILLTGSTTLNPPYNPISEIHRNNGDHTFTEQTDILLTAVDHGSSAWGDYDNDGDLDILLTGIPGSGSISKIYLNNSGISNLSPDKPVNLSYEVNFHDILFYWNRVTTDETAAKSISYNLRIGRGNNGYNFVSPQSAQDGSRYIASIGNAQLDSTFLYKNLRWDTTYYTSVQAVDNSFKGGAFSEEVELALSPVQPHDLCATVISNTSLLLTWKRGNGDRCIIFAKEGASGISNPLNFTSYYYNPIFGEGSPLGATGWYCIYKGEGDSVLLSGLLPNTNYSIHAIEFQGASGNEIYANEITTENIGVFSTDLFIEQQSILLNDVQYSSSSWGDYDNDGYLDILLTGSEDLDQAISKIYRNNGDNTFIEQTEISLMGIHFGAGEWGDYDNDSDLDILLAGHSTEKSRIYSNNNNNTFTEQNTILLPRIYYGDVEWGDYDNDGFLDFLCIGEGDNGLMAHIYRNEGNNSFSVQIGISLTGVNDGSIEWGDYDNDGDLDILLTGYSYSGAVTKIYSNKGENNFVEVSGVTFTGVYYSSVNWCDFNNDGNLDFLLTGRTENYDCISRIYINSSDDSFYELTDLSLTGVCISSTACGDFNNDGYIDIFLTGMNYSDDPVAGMYFNNGDLTFLEQSGISIPGVSWGSIDCGDYDNDGDLDILLTGQKGSYPDYAPFSRIYRNNLIMKTFRPNTLPDMPTNLESTIRPENIKLSWAPVTTDETPSETMSYNVRYRLKDSIFWMSAPQASDDGYRKVPEMGNAFTKNNFYLDNLPSGTYYWQVQAVDQGYMGGVWSEVDSFELKNVRVFYSSDIVCLGAPTHFTDKSVASEGISSWSWDFNDGSSSSEQNPSYTYLMDGTYNVKLVITDNTGIKDSLTQTVIVKAKPIADFSAPAVCQGTASTFTNTTDINGLTISSWYWDFGDGQISLSEQPEAHGYLGAAGYTVVLKALADNGCIDTITKTVTVAGYPVAAVTADAPLAFCEGDSATLSVPYNNDYLYTWKLNETAVSGADSSNFVAKLTGSYTAEVINSKGNCKTSSSITSITANDAPAQPYILTNGVSTLCQGDSVVLNVTNTPGYSYQWRLNGGSVGDNSNIYIARISGSYDLVVLNSIGCKATSVSPVPVIVNPMPVLSIISVKGNEKFCTGESVTLSVPSNVDYSYDWKRGTNTLDLTTNSIVASESGEYTVDISLAGCKKTADPVKIEVVQKPLKPAIDTSFYDKGMCLGESPLKISVDGAVAGYSYKWYRNGTPLSNSTSVEVLEEGIYYLEAVYDICTSLRDSAVIDFRETLPKPDIIARGPTVWYLSTTAQANYYKWYYNGNHIPEADNKLYVAGQKLGIYSVSIAANEGDCYAFSDTIRIPTGATAIENIDPFASVKIYPNPSSGMFTIEMNNNVFGELVIDIFSQNGRKMLNIKFEKTTGHFSGQIDLSGQPGGMYIINMAIEKWAATGKILVE